MRRDRDKLDIGDDRWQVAVAREAIIQPLARIGRLSPADVLTACRIERLIGTMMGAVHMLPGTTFSDIVKRGDYDPERHAVMTLEELDRWLASQIVGCYHLHLFGLRYWDDVLSPWAGRVDRRLRVKYDPREGFAETGRSIHFQQEIGDARGRNLLVGIEHQILGAGRRGGFEFLEKRRAMSSFDTASSASWNSQSVSSRAPRPEKVRNL